MYDFNEVEGEVLNFWKKKKIFEKLKKQNKGKKRWRFIDGPITANNPMGVHHAEGRTYKDLFHRFKAMQGHEIRYQNGFDCQGLWVEREEEKDLGLKDKKDIEKFGILNFVQACKKRVEKFSKVQAEQSILLGYWMDWDNSYYTMSDNNNLHNWFLLKTYFDKGWLYKGKDVVPWCWRCGTASSKHDIVTEGYREVSHKAMFMQFPVKGKKDEYFLIWTTTPWTVPANVVIAVNPDLDYVKIENKGKKYWLAEKRLEEISGNYKIIEKKKGKILEGVEYEMPYSNLEKQKKVNPKYEVILWELASEEEGTGIVHLAFGCGADDFLVGKRLGLLSKAISPLDEAGFYLDGFGNFSNKKYSIVNGEVLEDMEKRGFAYKIEKYKHRYPHCWRCSEELVFRLVDEWYISSKGIRKKLISENKKVEWYPLYGKKRQEDWFKNMDDWLISRKRYWGLPLPIWECSCGNVEIIGSLKELKEKAIDKKKVLELKEIHRPWIDKIKIKCKKCKKEVSRIEDVGDAWLDAGIVPFSTLNYLNDKSYWKKWFPADLISENMPGQYRGWFNALMWASVTLAGKAPFNSVFGYESVKDEKGEEMHKSKGNAIWFDDAVKKVGADTMRLLFCRQNPTQELKFGFNVLKEQKNQINILYNLGRLVENSKSKKTNNVEDEWILSRFNSLIKFVTHEMEDMHIHTATRALESFWLNDLSRKYIQIVRDRISTEEESVKSVLNKIYIDLIKLCAPTIPFVTEKIWQDMKNKKIVKEESVHLSQWPSYDEKKIDEELERKMEFIFQIIEAGLRERDKTKIGLKWPLKSVKVFAQLTSEFKEGFDKGSENIIKSQLNVKNVDLELYKGIVRDVNIFTKLNFDTNLTPELEAEGFARELNRQVQAFRKKLGLNKNDKIELIIFTDNELKNTLESQKDFIKIKTNSTKFKIFSEGVTTYKERFKSKCDFKIKNKRGEIVIKKIVGK